MNRLPRHLDDLRGLRAAEWSRESTRGQYDAFGPEAQRDQRERMIERTGLVRTGLEWSVAHSGRTIGSTAMFADMLERAGHDYDVLVVGYVSRFARDLRTAVNARHELHARGAAILFCDERLLSSDEEAWEQWAREAVEAEAYSRRLGKRIREGYAAKFRRHGDQGGSAPRGFRRTEERPHLLEPDPAAIGAVVALFERYASATVSIADLAAETGWPADGIRATLANPIYNGRVRRHRRSGEEEVLPARWRTHPPVSDELWARVQEVRAGHWTGGGRPTPVHVHLLAGRLFCAACGVRVRATSSTKARRWTYRRYRHPERCAAWPQESYDAARLERVIGAQVAGMRIDDTLRVRLRRLAEGTVAPPDATALRRRQLERELRERAIALAERRISLEVYSADHHRITAAIDELAEQPRAESVDPDRALYWLRHLKRAWVEAGPQDRRALVAALYDRVNLAGDQIVGSRLTPAAYAHGADLAMPESVLVARPAGARRGRSTERVACPVEFRSERLRWLRQTRSA